MPRDICIGDERKHYPDACTNVMSYDSNLLISLSIPILLTLDASVQTASAIKGTPEEKELYNGVSVDGQNIIREIKSTRDKTTWEKRNVSIYVLHVPKAQTKLPDRFLKHSTV